MSKKCHFQITSIDAEGIVVENETAQEGWCLSELDYHFDRMKKQLYKGEIAHIIVDNMDV